MRKPSAILFLLMRRRVLIALAAAGLVAVVVIGLTQTGGTGKAPTSAAPTSAEARTRLAGAPKPLAELHDQSNQLLQGGKSAFRSRLAGLKGYPAVVNFWAAWCGPCRFEFPFFQSTSVNFGKRVAFLAVDYQDNRGAAQRFLRKFPVTYPSYEDGKGAIGLSAGVQGLPTTVFYDRAGKVSFVHQGAYPTQKKLIEDVRRYALAS